MSSLIQEIDRSRAAAEASCTNIIGSLASLIRNVVTDLSRAINHGIKIFKSGIRQNTQCNYPPASSQLQVLPQLPQATHVADDHDTFLACFEQQHGTRHPFFYACSFEDGMKLARDELKFMFMYLHSPRHPFVHSFCQGTLCCEVVVQFLDANFVSWGAVAEWGEGVHMSLALRPNSFPFCALIAPSADNSISVLQQIEGPVSADELVEILQRTVEEQGSAYGHSKPENAEKMKNVEDAALMAPVKIDNEKHDPSISNPSLAAESSIKSSRDGLSHSPAKQKHRSTVKSAVASSSSKDEEMTKILIRVPNGERMEQSFKSNDKIEQLYWFIDSLTLPGLGNFQLMSALPRRVFGVEEMEMSFKDAGLHPRASLFLEPL